VRGRDNALVEAFSRARHSECQSKCRLQVVLYLDEDESVNKD
jgi:hypothetical protein